MKTTIKITPLSKEMKNLVKQHGQVWNRLDDCVKKSDKEICIETTVMVHCSGTQPYACWATLGVDCEIEILG